MSTGAALFSVALGVGVARQSPLVVAAIGLLAFLFVLVKPYEGSLLLVVSAFSVQILTSNNLLPSSAALLQDGISAALVAAVILRVTRNRQRGHKVVGSRWLVALGVFAVVGTMVNAVSLGPAVLGIRAVIRFMPLLFVPVVYEWRDKWARTVVWTLLGLILIQAPVAVVQFLLRTGISGDPVSGTLGRFASGQLTTVIVAGVTLLIGMYLYGAMSRVPAMASMIMLAIPPALNETKVFFAVAPLVWAGMLFPRMGKRWANAMGLLIALAVSIVLVGQSYLTVYGSGILTSEGAARAIALQTEVSATGGVLGRVPSAILAWEEISKTPRTLLFGHGPGSVTRNAQTGLAGTLVLEYGRALANTTFLVRLLLEYGLAGCVCFAGFLASVYRSGRRLERSDSEAFWRATGVGLQGMVITFAVLSVYTSTFTSDAISCIMWATAGVCALRTVSVDLATTESVPAAAPSVGR